MENESYFDRLKAHLYKFEVIHGEAILRLYINGQRKDAHIIVEPEKGIENYLILNLKQEDVFSLTHWFKTLKKEAI